MASAGEGQEVDEPSVSATLRSAGLDALLRGAWSEAADRYEAALALEITAESLEGYATARWWCDDVTAAIEARERAYALRRGSGETAEAAYDAAFLAWDHGAMRGTSAVASGWLQRARRLVEELPPAGEHAWLPLIEATFHLDTDASEVLRLSTEAAELAHAHAALDVEMTARTLQGLALVTLGRPQEGMRLLDEGTAAATSGELHDPIAVGSCCCNMIIACERACDFDRAGQWCEQLLAFSERTGQRPLLALCRAHHGTVLTMRGDWGPAEAELGWAAGELATLRPPLARYARARLAELRRRQGRRSDARRLLDQAEGHVLAPLGRAAVALDEDDLTGALAHAERYLRRLVGDNPVDAAAALELLVAIRIRRDELPLAHEAHDRLTAIGDAVATDPLRAAERAAAGRLALARRDADSARRAFEDAVDLYASAGEPFECADARLALAEALVASDREVAARGHAVGAASTFEALGAAAAARRASELARRLGAAARPAGARLTRRELDVLALVADGLSNRQIAEQLVVSEHTVHRHVANVLTKLGVPSRAAAVARAAEDGLLG